MAKKKKKKDWIIVGYMPWNFGGRPIYKYVGKKKRDGKSFFGFRSRFLD